MGPFEAEQADALRQDLEKIDQNFAVDIGLSLVLPNKVDARTNLAEEYLESFKEAYLNAIAPHYISYSQDIRNAAESGETAFSIAEPSATADRAREAYLDASTVLVERLGGGTDE